MNELQFWHWLATGSITVIMSILGFLGMSLSKRLTVVEKEKVEMDRFEKLGDYLATMARTLESHAQRDEDHFAKLTDTIHMNHAEMLRALNSKEN